MTTMTVQLRLRIAPEPVPDTVTKEASNAALLDMLRWITLPDTAGSSVPWPGNQADLDVEYEQETGLQVRTDLLAKVQAWLVPYAEHYRAIREPQATLLLEPVPESRGIYYYFDEKELWCSVHLALYEGKVDPANEWTLLGVDGVKAKVQIGLRYPMLAPLPNVETVRAVTPSQRPKPKA